MRYTLLTLSLLLICSLSGCDSTRWGMDGLWDPMQWVTESGAKASASYRLPKEGGEITLHCRNYKHPWVSNIKEDDEYYHPQGSEDSYYMVEGKWSAVTCVGASLTIRLRPNETETGRRLHVVVTAGDVFHHFEVKQE